MKTRSLAARALVTTALCATLIGLGTGAAEAKPRDCGMLQARFDQIMAYAEGHGQGMSQFEWDMLRQTLHRTSDRMDALGC